MVISYTAIIHYCACTSGGRCSGECHLNRMARRQNAGDHQNCDDRGRRRTPYDESRHDVALTRRWWIDDSHVTLHRTPHNPHSISTHRSFARSLARVSSAAVGCIRCLVVELTTYGNDTERRVGSFLWSTAANGWTSWNLPYFHYKNLRQHHDNSPTVLSCCLSVCLLLVSFSVHYT